MFKEGKINGIKWHTIALFSPDINIKVHPVFLQSLKIYYKEHHHGLCLCFPFQSHVCMKLHLKRELKVTLSLSMCTQDWNKIQILWCSYSFFWCFDLLFEFLFLPVCVFGNTLKIGLSFLFYAFFFYSWVYFLQTQKVSQSQLKI